MSGIPAFDWGAMGFIAGCVIALGIGILLVYYSVRGSGGKRG